MTRIGTPLSPTATKVMLLGAGELGKEVIIELQRLGVETIAVDRYADAPGQQVAHRAHVITMTDAAALRAVVDAERPHIIVPEIEAIATDELARIEAEGLAVVIPTARAVQLTMNREGIRRLAAEELEPAHLALRLRLDRRRAGERGGAHRLSMLRQAGDVLVRQGPELRRDAGANRARPGPMRWPVGGSSSRG